MRILLSLLLATSLVLVAAAQSRPGTGNVIEINPWGRPKVNNENALAIWQDDGGWHIRSYAGKKSAVHFSGTIRVFNGKVTRISGTQGLETGKGRGKDRGEVSQDKKVIAFQFSTLHDGEDGFDFELTAKAVQLEVSVLSEKYDHPELVRIGARGQRAPAATFILPVTVR